MPPANSLCFPVSKLRHYQYLASNSRPGLDMLLLLAAMSLTLRVCNEDEIDPLYRNAKRSLLEAEMCGVISLRTLQAALLISLFEMGNSLYPAAYLTAGYCARLAYALGIHDRRNAPQAFPKPGWPPDAFVTRLRLPNTSSVLDRGRRSPASVVGRVIDGQVHAVLADVTPAANAIRQIRYSWGRLPALCL